MLLQGIVVGAIWVYFILKRRYANSKNSKPTRIIRIPKTPPNMQEDTLVSPTDQSADPLPAQNLSKKISVIPPLYQNKSTRKELNITDMPHFKKAQKEYQSALGLFEETDLRSINLPFGNQPQDIGGADNKRQQKTKEPLRNKEEWKPVIKFKRHKKISKYRRGRGNEGINQALEAVSEVSESSKQSSQQTPFKVTDRPVYKQVDPRKHRKLPFKQLQLLSQYSRSNESRNGNLFSKNSSKEQKNQPGHLLQFKQEQSSTASQIYGEMYNPYDLEIDQFYD